MPSYQFGVRPCTQKMSAPRCIPYQRFDSPEPPSGSFAELFLPPLSVDIGDCKVTSKKDGRFDKHGQLLFSVVFISRGTVLQVVDKKYSELAAFSRTIFERRLVGASERALFPAIPLPEAAAEALAAAGASNTSSTNESPPQTPAASAAPVPHQRRASLLAQFGAAVGSPATLRFASAVAAATDAVGGDHSSSSSSSSNGGRSSSSSSGIGFGSGRAHALDDLELPDGEMTAEDDARAVGVVIAGLKKWLNAVWAAQPTFHRLTATREFFGLCDAVVSLPVRPRLWSAAAPPFLAHYKYPLRMAPQATGGKVVDDDDDEDDDDEEDTVTSEVSPEEARALDVSNNYLPPYDAGSEITHGNNNANVPLPGLDNQQSNDSNGSIGSDSNSRRNSRHRSSGFNSANGLERFEKGSGWRSLKGRLFGSIERDATKGWTEEDAEDAWASLRQRGLVPRSSSNHSRLPQVELMVTFQEGEMGLSVVNSDEQRDAKGFACGDMYVAKAEGQALRLRIEPGDRILAYNGKPLRPGLRHPEFMLKLMRKGRPLILALMRQAQNNSLPAENASSGSNVAVNSITGIRRSSRNTSGSRSSGTGANSSSVGNSNNISGEAPSISTDDDEDAQFEALFFKRLAELARREGNARAARAAIREAQVAKERERRWAEEEASKSEGASLGAAESSADAHVSDVSIGSVGEGQQVEAAHGRSNGDDRNDANGSTRNDNRSNNNDSSNSNTEIGIGGSTNSISSNNSISGGVLDALSSVSQGLDLLRSSSLSRVEPFRLGAALGLDSSHGLQNVSSSELSHVLASLSESDDDDEENEDKDKDDKHKSGGTGGGGDGNKKEDDSKDGTNNDSSAGKSAEVGYKRSKVLTPPQLPPPLPTLPPEPLPEACVLHVSGLPYCAVAEVWENQRYSAVNKRAPWGSQTGVGGHFMLGDRAPFSDDAGRVRVNVRRPPPVHQASKSGTRRNSRGDNKSSNSSISSSNRSVSVSIPSSVVAASHIDTNDGSTSIDRAEDADAAAHNPLLGGTESSGEETDLPTPAPAIAGADKSNQNVPPVPLPVAANAAPDSTATITASAANEAPTDVNTGAAAEFRTPEQATAAGLHESIAPPLGYAWSPPSQGAGSDWQIDRCHTATDAQGFSYAVDFWALAPLARRGASLTYDGSGCFVRRRRWCRALHVGTPSSLSSGRTNAPTPALSRLATFTSSYPNPATNISTTSTSTSTTSAAGDVSMSANSSDMDLAAVGGLDLERLQGIASARGACSRRLLTMCLSRVQHRVAFLDQPAYGFPENQEGGAAAATAARVGSGLASNNGSQDRSQGHSHKQRTYAGSSSHSNLDASSGKPLFSSCGEWGFGIGPAPLLLAGRTESVRGGAMEAAATRSFAALCGFLEGAGFDALWSGGAVAVVVAQRNAARHLAKSLLRAGWPAAAYVRGPSHKQSLVDDTHAVNGPRVVVTTDLDLMTDLNAAVATSAMQSLALPTTTATSSNPAPDSAATDDTAAVGNNTSSIRSSTSSSTSNNGSSNSGGGGDADADFSALVAAAIAECQCSEGSRCAEAATRAANALKGWPHNSSSSSSRHSFDIHSSSGGSGHATTKNTTHGARSSVFGALCPLPVLACVHFDLPRDLGTYLRRLHRLFEPLLSNSTNDLASSGSSLNLSTGSNSCSNGIGHNSNRTSSGSSSSSSSNRVSLQSWAPLSVSLADPQHDACLLPHMAALVADAGQLQDNPPHLTAFLLDQPNSGGDAANAEPLSNSVAGRSSRSSSNASTGSSSSSIGSSSGSSSSDTTGSSEPLPLDGSVVRTGLDGAGLAMGMASSIAAAFGGMNSTSNVSNTSSSTNESSSSQDVVHSRSGVVNPFNSFAESIGKALADHFPPTEEFTADLGDEEGVVFREPAPQSGVKLPSWPNRRSAHEAAASGGAATLDDEGDASELMEGSDSWQPSNGRDDNSSRGGNSTSGGGSSDSSAFTSAFGSSSSGSSSSYNSSSTSSTNPNRSSHQIAPAELAEQASVGGVAHVDLAGLAHVAGTMTTTLGTGHDSAGSLAAAAAAMNSTATAAIGVMPPTASSLLNPAGSGWTHSGNDKGEDNDDDDEDGDNAGDGSYLDSGLNPGSGMDFSSWHTGAPQLEDDDEEADFEWEPARASGEDF